MVAARVIGPLLLIGGLALAPARGDDAPRPTVERRGDAPATPAPAEPIDVTLRLPRLRWVSGADLLPQVSLTRLPPGALVIRYAGLQAVVVRRVQGHLRDRWHASLRDAWAAGVLSDERYEAALERMFDALADHRAGGRWWERSWLDSLPASRGGAPDPPLEHVVGERVALRLGPLILTSDLRLQVERVGALAVEPDAPRPLRRLETARLAREHAWLRREVVDAEDLVAGEVGPPEGELEAAPARPGLAPALLRPRWRLTLRPAVRVRASGGHGGPVRDVRVRAVLELFRGPARLRFLEVELALRYRPEDDEVVVGVELALVTW
ncbi:MAG: hypothetical protein M9894_37220 [Planctomycetes bacterium]|nr:hypothetical protein [Planctomycetota bacterium]